MPETLDPNIIVADLVARSAERIASALSEKPATAVRRAWQAITNAYSPYLEQTYRKVSTIKTFLKTNEPTNIIDAYVNLSAEFGLQIVDDLSIIEEFKSGKQIVVTASAGRGKSMLLRYIASTLYTSGNGIIPLFIELRSLNSITEKDILAYIHSTYSGDSGIKYADFEKSLASGRFCLILDGFDEVNHESRNSVESRILDICNKYPSTPLIISSRPDDRRFSSWEKFHYYKITQMSLSQVREMITKCDYDREVKRSFLKKLDQKFYNDHEDFLGTPLLATLLMLTFELNAEIPKTIHTFYENAFFTLARRHDAMKAQFLRKTYSNCTVDDFASIFSAFCFLSYCKWQFQFSEKEILKTIEMSAKKFNIEEDARNLLNDYIESICVIQMDGLEYSFVHRSFQEYFSAVFLSKSPLEVCRKYLDEGIARYYDNVLSMWFAMDRDRLERDWISDAVSEILNLINSDISNFDLFRKIANSFDLGFQDGNLYHVYISKSEFGTKISAIFKMYEEEFDEIGFHPNLLTWIYGNEDASLKGILKCLEESDHIVRDINRNLKRSKGKRGSEHDIYTEVPHELLSDEVISFFEVENYRRKLAEGLSVVSKKLKNSLKSDDDFLKQIFN